ncbi:TPA: hypothetical protein R8G57_001486 [Citrobacter freundii]|nr:hypothetical protein [Citrobacter freundii]
MSAVITKETRDMITFFVETPNAEIQAFERNVESARGLLEAKMTVYEPHYVNLGKIEASIKQINNYISEEEMQIHSLNEEISDSGGDINLIEALADRKNRIENKLKTLYIALNGMRRDFAMEKVNAFNAYAEYIGAIDAFNRNRIIMATGKLIFQMREQIDRAIIEGVRNNDVNMQVVYHTVYEYMHTVVPSSDDFGYAAECLEANYDYPYQAKHPEPDGLLRYAFTYYGAGKPGMMMRNELVSKLADFKNIQQSERNTNEI